MGVKVATLLPTARAWIICVSNSWALGWATSKGAASGQSGLSCLGALQVVGFLGALEQKKRYKSLIAIQSWKVKTQRQGLLNGTGLELLGRVKSIIWKFWSWVIHSIASCQVHNNSFKFSSLTFTRIKEQSRWKQQRSERKKNTTLYRKHPEMTKIHLFPFHAHLCWKQLQQRKHTAKFYISHQILWNQVPNSGIL